MLNLMLAVLALGGSVQASAPQEVPVLNANLGDCSTDFVVRGTDGQPIYNALIHVRVRYGVFSLKRSDLEIGTNADGKARIEGLPNKAKPLAYDVRKDNRRAAVEQNVSDNCRAMFDLTLE
jgi:hypothetical protein